MGGAQDGPYPNYTSSERGIQLDMALPRTADKVIEVLVQGILNGQNIENTFYVHAADVVTAAMVAEIAEIVGNWVADTFLAVVGNNYVHNRVVARDLSTIGSFEAIIGTASGTAGSAGAVDGAGNETLAFHRRTDRSGVYQKSRIYWPNIEILGKATNNAVTSGWAAEKIAALQTLFDNIAAGTLSTYLNGYVQRVVAGVPLAVGLFVECLGWTTTDLFIDSMRRRLTGRGA